MKHRIKLFGIIVIAAAMALTAFGCGSGVAGFNAGLPVDMVKIEGGTFTMGSPEDEHSRGYGKKEIQHQVTLSGFYMGKYEVTQKQYEAVMDYNPSYFKGANLPVESVSWYNAIEFCNKLSKKEGREPVYTMTDVERNGSDIKKMTVTADWSRNGYRLPTEAEWEYACRAGTTTTFNTGNNITAEQANFNKKAPSSFDKLIAEATKEKIEVTTPVGSFKPNAWGLYDMHGNVSELCWDWYDENYYSSSPAENPKGPAVPVINYADKYYGRVSRGGSVADKTPACLRSASRDSGHFDPNEGYEDIGFRVVRNL